MCVTRGFVFCEMRTAKIAVGVKIDKPLFKSHQYTDFPLIIVLLLFRLGPSLGNMHIIKQNDVSNESPSSFLPQ